MKTKGRRKSDNIIDMRPGKSGDPMFESAKMMAGNQDEYSRRATNRRRMESVKNSDTFKEAGKKFDELLKKKRNK